jgi:hypothetical protein
MRSVVASRTCRSGPLAAASAAAITVALAAGCGEQAARVQLVPLGGDCARPAGANEVKVTAYGPSGSRTESIRPDEVVAFASFPADTEQFAVEVSVGGVLAAEGKSAPLAFNTLPDGGKIYVLMAPPDGFCELPPMLEARSQPLVAPAGRGALVVGGNGPSGSLATAEYFDPTIAAFVAVEVPQALAAQGFAGAALATLPDGRVALTGGPRSVFIVFDPDRRAFVTDPTAIDPRAFHAAIATGAQEVLLAGGCTAVTMQQCGEQAQRQTERYGLATLSVPALLAVLASGYRTGAQLFDLGVQLDGARRYLLAGGVTAASVGDGGAPGRADRFALADLNAEVVMGLHAQPAALDGGAVLTAFAQDTAAKDGAASVIAPGAPAAHAIARAPDLTGVRLVALEDGRVLGFGAGGDLNGSVLSYDPTHDAWGDVDLPQGSATTGALSAPSLARLADGTVLVVGGAMSSRAWLYRPSLVGPTSPTVTVAPASLGAGGVLTAPDPATVMTAPAAWQLTAPADEAMARALVGGPRMAVGSVTATVHVLGGGVALIARQTGPGEALVARMTPGNPAQLVQLTGGAEQVKCTAPAAVAPFDPGILVTLHLTLTDHDARLTRGDVTGADQVLLTCSLPAGDRGAWGVATLGTGAQLTVEVVTVTRESPST